MIKQNPFFYSGKSWYNWNFFEICYDKIFVFWTFLHTVSTSCFYTRGYKYRISSYSVRTNYSFLNLEIVENSNSCRKFQSNKQYFCLGKLFKVETIWVNSKYSKLKNFIWPKCYVFYLELCPNLLFAYDQHLDIF